MAEENNNSMELDEIQSSGRFGDIAAKLNNNFRLIIEAILKKRDGKSAYELWVEQPGNEGKTLNEFLASLKESGYKMQAVTVRPSTIAEIESGKIYLYPDGTGQFSTAIYTGDLNSTYDSTKWVVLATNPGDLSGAFTDIQGLRVDVNNLSALVGHFTCDTAAATYAKTVNATGYVLTNGGNIRIKMEHANTAESGVTLQIGSAAAKELYYNNEPVSSDNTWEDNEVILVYYDGTRYIATNSLGGGGGDIEALVRKMGMDYGYTVTYGQGNIDQNGEVTGESTSSNFYFLTSPIPCLEGQIFRITATLTGNASYRSTVMFYLGTTLVERRGIGGADVEVVVPSGCDRVRFASNNGSLFVTPPDNVVQRESAIAMQMDFASYMLDASGIAINTISGYYDRFGVVTGSGTTYATDILPTTEGLVWKYKGAMIQASFAIFYYKNNQLITSQKITATTDYVDIVTPFNVDGIRFTSTGAELSVVPTNKVALLLKDYVKKADMDFMLSDFTIEYSQFSGYYKADHTVASGQTTTTTGIVNVYPGQVFQVKCNALALTYTLFYFNDENLVKAEKLNTNGEFVDVTIPSGVNKAEFASVNQSLTVIPPMTIGRVIEQSDIGRDVKNNNAKITGFAIHEITGTFKVANGAVVYSSSESWKSKYTDKIPCVAGQVFRYHGKGSTIAACYAIFDENGSVVRSLSNADYTSDTHTVTIETGESFIQFFSYNASNAAVVLVVSCNDAIGLDRIAAGNVLWGKEWCVFGDSFSSLGFGDYKHYSEWIAERNNMDLRNYAVSGSTLKYFCENRLYEKITVNTGFVTIWYGINDNYSLGEIDDEVADISSIAVGDANTFYGVYNAVCHYLLEHFPNIHVGIIVTGMPGHFGNTATESARTAAAARREAIRNVAKRWGYPYLDIMGDDRLPALHSLRESGLCSTAIALRTDAFTGSSDHPNAACHKFESNFIEEFLRRI